MPALFTLWGQRSQSVIGFSVLSVVYNKQDQGARHCLPRSTLENKFITEQNKHLWSDHKRSVCRSSFVRIPMISGLKWCLMYMVSCVTLRKTYLSQVISSALLTTLVLVKVIKVNFPLLLPVCHVAEELVIIQEAIFVFIIRINDVLWGTIIFQLALDAVTRVHVKPGRWGTIRCNCYLNPAVRRDDPVLLHLTVQLRHRHKPIFVLVQFDKKATKLIHGRLKNVFKIFQEENRVLIKKSEETCSPAVTLTHWQVLLLADCSERGIIGPWRSFLVSHWDSRWR